MADVADQVIDFYNALFERIFFAPFSSRIAERRRRDTVRFQILEAAGAASQSLERFFAAQQVTSNVLECILDGLNSISRITKLEHISNPNEVPEKIVDDLLGSPASSAVTEGIERVGQAAVFRVALYSVVQALMQVGPVMAEWQNIGFPTTFELSRRVIARLNEISQQLDALGRAGSEAADERYELLYRDYLAQRFYRVEAGTVRMTTNLAVDLRELLVMPNVLARTADVKVPVADAADSTEPMPLSRAREALTKGHQNRQESPEKSRGVSVLDQLRQRNRNVIVGLPGSGKSTFLEWFQLKAASAEEQFPLAGQQAIPILIRVRQLDAKNLPRSSGLIEKATNSRDLANLMPPGWLDRKMSRGAVILMLDGLDEVDPEIRDNRILPWFIDLCNRYSKCAFVVSSRPVGYPSGTLRRLGFAECELLDFTEPQTAEYARHWCTAIRLARNETAAEARREGTKDGDAIIEGFKGYPYISSLARNPLMLSAICLVNYFENGRLPTDRAVLYRLCVEGLLHNWDQRRGIRSDFTFDEKLRASREVALRMQADDRAEYELDKVLETFRSVLNDSERAEKLLEHVRYRTGLLLERRTNIFAFAHLTFQEYLAARAVFEGNRSGIEIDRLLKEYRDPKWQEVIALYCGLAALPAARKVVESLSSTSPVVVRLLLEAYFAAGPAVAEDGEFRRKAMSAAANGSGDWSDMEANRFGPEEFAPFAHEAITRGARVAPGHAYMWLYEHPDRVDFARIVDHIRKIPDIDLTAASEMNILVHLLGPDSVVAEVARTGLYSLPHPHSRRTLAESTLQALSHSKVDLGLPGPGRDAAWIAAVKVLLASTHKTYLPLFIRAGEQGPSRSAWPEFEPLLGELTRRSRMTGGSASTFERLYADLSSRYGDAPKAPRPRQPRTKKARQRGA